MKHQKAMVRREVKWDMIAGLDKTELVLFKFTKKESETKLHWEHSKEFEYKGQMYDVVETVVHGDTTYYRCWWDSKETKLNKQLDELLAYFLGKDQQKKDNQKRLVNFYKSLYCAPLFGSGTFTFQAEQLPTPYKFSYLTISNTPPVPPPKLV